MPVSNITGRRINGFAWNFRKRSHMRQGTICNIFGVLRLTSWIQDRFFSFLDPCFLVISLKIEWTDFKKFAWYVGHDTTNNQLYCLTPDFLVSRSPIQARQRVCYGKIDERIFMNFSGYVGCGTRNNLEHFGDDAYNPWDTWFLFLFFFVRVC